VRDEPEKCDAVAAAGKPTNKAEQSAAEPVEPKTATKGNAGQRSTRRAQDRVGRSPTLERVRQAARQRKKEKFTSPVRDIGPAMPRTEFCAIKRDAAPGVGGMTWGPASRIWIAGLGTCEHRPKAERTGRRSDVQRLRQPQGSDTEIGPDTGCSGQICSSP
jgi:hypothetical protein